PDGPGGFAGIHPADSRAAHVTCPQSTPPKEQPCQSPLSVLPPSQAPVTNHLASADRKPRRPRRPRRRLRSRRCPTAASSDMA
ncbi:MAG: hypothetical protein LC713_04045, partial [Actinobacteria bacterium]|nr:hypothetical protein [Actinomycetota bacterium]